MSTDTSTATGDGAATDRLIIIGSGPAGYTAAIYAARAGLAPRVIAGSVTHGGALMNTTEVENFPGFPGGIQGPELMAGLSEQAQRFGAVVEYDDAATVRLSGQLKEVTTLEEALFLTRFARTVTVVVRRDALRASRIMAQRAKDNEKIRFAWNSAVTAVHGTDKVTGVTLSDTTTGATRELAATGLFVAIGHLPRTDLVKGQLELDEEGYIVVDAPTTVTSLPGVFACGDAVDHRYRQAITAAGTGCAAGLDAERYLAALEDADSIATALVEETTHG
jgi:thioredoxin reductase (NADPH)